MRLLRTKRVRIDKLLLPADFRQRMERVKEQAADLAITPLLQRPGVQADGRTIIYGNDRIAMLKVSGATDVEVDVWEGEPSEYERAEVVENFGRRHENRDALKASLVQWHLKNHRQTPVGTTTETVSSEPAITKTAAREAAAVKLGTTVEAIRSAERRAEKKVDLPGMTPEKPATCINDWGVAVPDEVMRTAAVAQGVVDEIDLCLRKALAAITRGQESLPEALAESMGLQGLRLAMKAAASDARASRPSALCPYCKAVASIRENCAGCRGTSLVGLSTMAGAPGELRAHGVKAGVYVEGGAFAYVKDLK